MTIDQPTDSLVSPGANGDGLTRPAIAVGSGLND